MQTFDTPTPIAVVVDVPAGRLRLVAADRTDATVDIRPADPSRARDVTAAERTTAELQDGALRVSAPVRHELLGPSGTVEVTVQLPAGSQVQAVGPVTVHGTGRLGEVTVRGAVGTITLDEVAAAHLDTAAGDITIEHLTGAAEISTAQGDIRVTEARHGSLVLSTRLGDITVGAASGVSAALDAGTTVGRISDALKNDGTPVLGIRATTTQGDITAHSL